MASLVCASEGVLQAIVTAATMYLEDATDL